MKHFPSLTFFFGILLAACASTTAPLEAPAPVPERRALNVFAATSLIDAFTEIGANFESENPGVTVTFNFAGSQALSTQITEGAPADVFASANTSQMDVVIAGGLVAQDATQMFLTNALVIIVPDGNPAGVTRVEDLTNPDLKLVLTAKEVPVGKYSRQAFDLMDVQYGNGFRDKVLANIVSNEDNVKQVVTKVQLGEADAGIVYTSDAVAAPELGTMAIPSEVNILAQYPIAPLVNSANPDLAAAFTEYVISSEGQAVLQKWGFGPIP